MTNDERRIARAWHSVPDRWVVRRNKGRSLHAQWEAVHVGLKNNGSDDTLLGVFATQASAELETRMHEDQVRAAAGIAELRKEPLK